MSVPTTPVYVLPFLSVPHVAADALTIGATLAGAPPLTDFYFRVYPRDIAGSYPYLHRKLEVAGQPASFIEYFTWEDLVPGLVYKVEVYSHNADGDSAHAIDQFEWDPDQDLYPVDDVVFPVGPRPWAWEDYAGQWLALLAWYYQNEPLTAELFHRLGQEFQRLSSAIEEVARFLMPSRSFGVGLDRWSELFGIGPTPGISDAMARAVVLAHTRGRLDPSATTLVESLQFILGFVPKITEDFPNFTLQIDLSATPEVQEIVQEVVRRIVPAHLVVTFGPSVFVFDWPPRRKWLLGVWPRGKSNQTPAGAKPGLFDSTGMQ